MDISVVVPVYGCPEALSELHRRLTDTLQSEFKDYEIILVDDCCPKDSWSIVSALCNQDSHVKGIRLSRNFGQMIAITAGLDATSGEWVVVMDCDLQDRPEAILDLYRHALDGGYDVVFAKRKDRKDTASVKFFSRLFYKVYSYFLGTVYDPDVCNFSVSKRKVIESYTKLRERNGEYVTFIKWLGFKQDAVLIEADKRFTGESSYSFSKKCRLAFNLITAQSDRPLRIGIKAGFAISLIAAIALVILVVQYCMGGVVEGWTSIVCAILLMCGIIMIGLGVLGIYIGNIFNEVKNRPLYIVSDSLNREASNNDKQ